MRGSNTRSEENLLPINSQSVMTHSLPPQLLCAFGEGSYIFFALLKGGGHFVALATVCE
jgi:hypothetical protein